MTAVRAIVAAALTVAAPAPAEAQQTGCARSSGIQSDYVAVFVIAGGGGCESLIRVQCARGPTIRVVAKSYRWLDVRYVQCSTPIVWVSITPRR